MYKEQVIENIKKAVEKSKKNPTQWIIMTVIGAVALAGSVWWMATNQQHRNYTYVVSYDDSDTIGVGGLILGAILFFGGLYLLFSTLKLHSKGAADRLAEKYLAQARKLGPEDEVFAQLEALTPLGSDDETPRLKDVVYDDLRISPTLIACTSENEPERNFICPLTDLTAAGISGFVPGIYLHHKENGKKKKTVAYIPINGQTLALSLLQQYAPGVVENKK